MSDRNDSDRTCSDRNDVLAAIDVIRLEAVYLDEHRWGEWLDLYAEDCEYWMPMWRTEETLNANPQDGLSHIYYASRAGLDDRIARITSRKSPASRPLPRTCHMLGTELVVDHSEDSIAIRSSWSCHVVFPRHRDAHAFFGSYRHELQRSEGGWRIRKKHIVLMNDYIPTLLDIYCV